jgi:hypothetical protein
VKADIGASTIIDAIGEDATNMLNKIKKSVLNIDVQHQFRRE